MVERLPVKQDVAGSNPVSHPISSQNAPKRVHPEKRFNFKDITGLF